MRRKKTTSGSTRAAARHVAVVADVREAIVRQYVQGILQYARHHGPWVILAEFNPAHASTAHTMRCDGAIGMFYDRSNVEYFRQRRIPVVNLSSGMDSDSVPTVRADGRAAGHAALEHLHERGFNTLAFVGLHTAAAALRREGFLAAARAHGMSVREFATPAGSPDWQADPGSLDAFLVDLPKPVGLFAAYEMTAWTVVGKCLDHSIAVPESVAVVTAGNDDITCEAADVPLSSVAYPGQRIGYEGASLLDRLMAGHRPPRTPVEIPPTGVVTRQSTDILAIPEPDVARAVRFIRERACTGLAVADLLRLVPVDRRWLERQFRTRLGRSPLQEIFRVRVDRARMLLTTSEMPLPDIARNCGFGQEKSFGDVFKDLTGWTPAAFRRAFRHSPAPKRFFHSDVDIVPPL